MLVAAVVVLVVALFGMARCTYGAVRGFLDARADARVLREAGDKRHRTHVTQAPGDIEPFLDDTLTDDEKLAYITADENGYPADLVRFAQTYPQVIDFVYHYPERVGTTGEIDLSWEASCGIVSRLVQWDDRWGYAEYGDGLLGRYGCGPTCLSVVALYLTGDATYTPLYVAQYAEENGYYTYGIGTAWSLMEYGGAGLGLTSTAVGLAEDQMAAQLEAGHPIVCAVGPGDFTSAGHFIVLADYSNGRFVLVDPNSPENSSRTWTFDELAPQIEGLWAFST